MTLGEKIAKQRKELNYTQEQLADILGVSRQSISKWVNILVRQSRQSSVARAICPD